LKSRGRRLRERRREHQQKREHRRIIAFESDPLLAAPAGFAQWLFA
jgi:hypothetical protein